MDSVPEKDSGPLEAGGLADNVAACLKDTAPPNFVASTPASPEAADGPDSVSQDTPAETAAPASEAGTAYHGRSASRDTEEDHHHPDQHDPSYRGSTGSGLQLGLNWFNNILQTYHQRRDGLDRTELDGLFVQLQSVHQLLSTQLLAASLLPAPAEAVRSDAAADTGAAPTSSTTANDAGLQQLAQPAADGERTVPAATGISIPTSLTGLRPASDAADRSAAAVAAAGGAVVGGGSDAAGGSAPLKSITRWDSFGSRDGDGDGRVVVAARSDGSASSAQGTKAGDAPGSGDADIAATAAAAAAAAINASGASPELQAAIQAAVQAALQVSRGFPLTTCSFSTRTPLCGCMACCLSKPVNEAPKPAFEQVV